MSGASGVDALPFVDSLIKEYLLFRGFGGALSAFAADAAADPGCGLQAGAITAHVFGRLIPALEPAPLVEFLEHLNMRLFSRLDARHEGLLAAVEADVLRLFLVTAARAKASHALSEFFRRYGPQLLAAGGKAGGGDAAGAGGSGGSGVDWAPWFVLPHLSHPEREPRFQVYFSAEWAALLQVSFRNFIAGVVASLPLPALLRFNTDRRLRHALQQQVAALQAELAETRQQLDAATAALQAQQQQQQQQQPAAAVAAMQQHKREASLDDWQLQQQQHQQQHAARQRAGSGLFDLLPQLSANAPPAQQLQPNAAAGALGGVQQPPGFSQGAPPPAGLADQQQQLQHHARAGSFSGISFEAPPAAPSSEPRNEDGSASSSGQEQEQAAASGSGGARAVPVGRGRTRDGTSASPNRSAPALLPSSPVLSWAGGSGGRAGVRPAAHLPPVAAAAAAAGIMGPHPGASGGGGRSGGAAATASSSPGVAPVPVQALQPVPAARGSVDVSSHAHQQPPADGADAAAAAAAGAGSGPGGSSSSSGSGGVSAVAFSPTGANVASVLPGGLVAISAPPDLDGNTGRAATVSCGAPVTCVAWERRADKLLLIGCSGGGGVRAWHADTRRVMATLPAEPGHPHVAALAGHPCEPTLAVASNSAGGERGRLALYNARSFKRSSVLPLPGDAPLASLAYSAGGGLLLAGTGAGTALLYEPGSRPGPVRVWHVADAVLSSGGGGSGARAVQVLWRPPADAAAAAPAAAPGAHTSSGDPAAAVAATPAAAGSMLTLCDGVLCEWTLAPLSKQPVAALDVAGAAAAAVRGQHDGSRSEGQPDAGPWQCQAAVSPDGSCVAVLCCAPSGGVLLLLHAAPTPSAAGEQQRWRAEAQVLMQGRELAAAADCVGGCSLSWHVGGRVLAVGSASSGACCYLVRLGAAGEDGAGVPETAASSGDASLAAVQA